MRRTRCSSSKSGYCTINYNFLGHVTLDETADDHFCKQNNIRSFVALSTCVTTVWIVLHFANRKTVIVWEWGGSRELTWTEFTLGWQIFRLSCVRWCVGIYLNVIIWCRTLQCCLVCPSMFEMDKCVGFSRVECRINRIWAASVSAHNVI